MFKAIKNSLRNKLNNFLIEDEGWDADNIGIDIGISNIQTNQTPNTKPVLNFRIYGASGGYVLEFMSSEKYSDNYSEKLYVINDSEDLSDAVNKILTMEFLKV